MEDRGDSVGSQGEFLKKESEEDKMGGGVAERREWGWEKGYLPWRA